MNFVLNSQRNFHLGCKLEIFLTSLSHSNFLKGGTVFICFICLVQCNKMCCVKVQLLCECMWVGSLCEGLWMIYWTIFYLFFSLSSFMQFSMFVCLLLQHPASILGNWWWATLWIFSMEVFFSTNYISMTFPSCSSKKDILILENFPSFMSLMEPHCLCKVVLLKNCFFFLNLLFVFWYCALFEV